MQDSNHTDRGDAVVLDAGLETVIRDYFEVPDSAIIDDVSTLDGDLRVTIVDFGHLPGVDDSHVTHDDPAWGNCGHPLDDLEIDTGRCLSCMERVETYENVPATDGGREQPQYVGGLIEVGRDVVLGLADVARLVLAVITVLAIIFAVLAFAGVMI